MRVDQWFIASCIAAMITFFIGWLMGYLDGKRNSDALREALRLGVEWNDDYMKINNLYGKVEWVEHSRKLLSLPASGEPARKP